MPPTGLDRRYALGAELTPRAARAVLTTPFAVDPLQRSPAYMADVSPAQSRWAGWEPPAPPRNVSGAADTTGPGECASHPGLDDEALTRQEAGWDPYPRERERERERQTERERERQREREAPNCFSVDVFDTPPAFSRATMDTAGFDPTQEYCTRDIVYFWQSPSFVSQWTPSRFTVEGISYSWGIT